jgi:hypothetical protein
MNVTNVFFNGYSVDSLEWETQMYNVAAQGPRTSMFTGEDKRNKTKKQDHDTVPVERMKPTTSRMNEYSTMLTSSYKYRRILSQRGG